MFLMLPIVTVSGKTVSETKRICKRSNHYCVKGVERDQFVISVLGFYMGKEVVVN